MKIFGSFTSIKRVQTFRRHWRNPLVEAVGHAETNGFPLLRPFPSFGTAYPTQGRKCRLLKISRHLLLNLFQGFMTYNPDREPKLNYTDTSFDAIKVRVSQFSLGGRGLTYFFPTYFLPFLILCNSNQ